MYENKTKSFLYTTNVSWLLIKIHCFIWLRNNNAKNQEKSLCYWAKVPNIKISSQKQRNTSKNWISCRNNDIWCCKRKLSQLIYIKSKKLEWKWCWLKLVGYEHSINDIIFRQGHKTSKSKKTTRRWKKIKKKYFIMVENKDKNVKQRGSSKSLSTS